MTSLSQAQEQLTLKPSVAKKLNERINALEAELAITRKQSNIAELEKKVAVSVAAAPLVSVD